MIAESNSELIAVRLLFGHQAELVKPRRRCFEIRRGGITLGSGSDFRQALQAALRSTQATGDVRSGSAMPQKPPRRLDIF